MNNKNAITPLSLNRLSLNRLLLFITLLISLLLIWIISYDLTITRWKKSLLRVNDQKSTIVHDQEQSKKAENNGNSAEINVVSIALPLTPTLIPTPTRLATNKLEFKQVVNTKQTVNTKQIYQQLISNQTINIELAWPNNSKEKAQLFNYLYYCAGMKFGVLNNASVTIISAPIGFARQSTVINNLAIKSDLSEWLRIAQGQLNNQEIDWLQQSGLTGTPVRLFPKIIDWQLAKKIARYTATRQANHGTATHKNYQLQSLRAYYALNQQGLYLKNIWFDHKLIAGTWQLTQMSCNV